MIPNEDINSFRSIHHLQGLNYPKVPDEADEFFHFDLFGDLTLSNSYQVKRINKVYQEGELKKHDFSKTKFLYSVTCVSRFQIAANNANFRTTPLSNVKGFKGYPVKLYKEIYFDIDHNKKNTDNNDCAARIKEFFPVTLNTTRKTSTSNSDGTGSSTGTSDSLSTGSSTSDTHTTSVGVSAGISGTSEGIMPSLSASVNSSDSHTTSSSTGSTSGTNASDSVNKSQSSSSSMSMKDWNALGTHFTYQANEVNSTNESVGWFFSQAYPWDSFFVNYDETNKSNNDPKRIYLSNKEKDRLCDGTNILPPSDFSLTGFNFLTKTTLIVDPEKLRNPSLLELAHKLSIVPAEHEKTTETITITNQVLDDKTQKFVPIESSIEKTSVVASIHDGVNFYPKDKPKDKNEIKDTINLPIVALSPLLPKVHSSVIGFIHQDFIVEPDIGLGFEAVSASNNLYIEGNNDGHFIIGDLGLKVTEGISKFTIYFKILDTFDDYHLFLKHWKSDDSNTLLKIQVNQKSVLEKVQLSPEGQGGQNNITEISLRNMSHASVDYHDYLRIGLNKIEIEVNVEGVNTYFLRALSIETL